MIVICDKSSKYYQNSSVRRYPKVKKIILFYIFCVYIYIFAKSFHSFYLIFKTRAYGKRKKSGEVYGNHCEIRMKGYFVKL
jgi:hypothetical protein